MAWLVTDKAVVVSAQVSAFSKAESTVSCIKDIIKLTFCGGCFAQYLKEPAFSKAEQTVSIISD